MKALVTGATGLIGANLVRALLRQEIDVRALVRTHSDVSVLSGLQIEKYIGDVLDLESILQAASSCDLIFHVASVFSYWGHSPQELETIAVSGARNVIEAAARCGIRRVILTSSSAIFGGTINPVVRDETSPLDANSTLPYISSKVRQQQEAFSHASEFGVELVSVCPTITVGPFDRKLSPSNAILVNYLADPLRTSFVGACNVVSAIDVANGHILAALKGESGETYLLGSENLDWSEVHQLISTLCGTYGPGMRLNRTFSYLAASSMEAMAKCTGAIPLSTRQQAAMVGDFYWYSHRRAASLGYEPRPARQAIAEALAWLIDSSHVSPATRLGLLFSDDLQQARARLGEVV